MAKKFVRVKAQCSGFDIEIEAKLQTKTLVAEEAQRVQKELKQRMQDMVSKLPFAHVYPFEVSVR